MLLITANPDLGERMTSVKRAQAETLLKNSIVVNIAGAGHNIRREQFAAYLAHVQGFLDQFDQ